MRIAKNRCLREIERGTGRPGASRASRRELHIEEPASDIDSHQIINLQTATKTPKAGVAPPLTQDTPSKVPPQQGRSAVKSQA